MAIIRPVISRWDDFDSPHSLAAHGLVSLLVAKAIIACLKTMVEVHPELNLLVKYVEFRARPCKLTFDWKITKDVMEDEQATEGA